MTRQHPSANCPLCGEKDILDHFLGCTGINGEGPYLAIRDEMRHRANKIGTPDNAINMIAQIMEGKAVEDSFLNKTKQKAFRDQEGIGWKHFVRGRITKNWGEIRNIDNGKWSEPASEWRSKFALVLLTWLDKKWRLRCQMSEAQTGNREHEELLKECRNIWKEKE